MTTQAWNTMTKGNNTTYKGYSIKQVGMLFYIFRPNTEIHPCTYDSMLGSMESAKRWINQDIVNAEENLFEIVKP
jgi:hypothetical protein